jgi:ATP-binding cassette subfamily B protein
MSTHPGGGSIIWRMARESRAFWPHIFGIFLISLLSTPLALLTPLPLKIVVDSVLGSRPLPKFIDPFIPQSVQQSSGALLTVSVCLLIGVTLMTYLQAMGSWLLQTYAGEGMVLDFRGKLFAHVQRLSLTYHDMKGVSDSAFRIQYDAPSLQLFTINGVIPLISASTTLIGMVYVMARLDLRLAFVALCVSPVLFMLVRIFSRRLKKRWRDVKRLESSANSVVEEVLSSMRVVKAFGREEHEQGRFVGRSTHRMRELIKLNVLQGIFDLLVGTTIACGTAAVLYIGVLHVRSGLLSLGDLMLVTAYIAQLFDPMKAISKNLASLQSYLASAERAFSLLDEHPEVNERPSAITLKRTRGEVCFEDVSFAYDGINPVLHGVSFNAPSGTRVGIQGRTGSGKSTLMSLLIRFYDVSNGRICVDGVDIRDYKLADLRNQFGIVLQDTVLFSTSVAENIAYGCFGASEGDIYRAAQLANAHDFIMSLPDGYDTLVGERGMRLSGGERQRISLARAFLKDAPILILDEPTSAVDVGTESAILDALERLMQGRTTFMIAHRLTTLDACDLRLEIQDGCLRKMEEVGANA